MMLSVTSSSLSTTLAVRRGAACGARAGGGAARPPPACRQLLLLRVSTVRARSSRAATTVHARISPHERKGAAESSSDEEDAGGFGAKPLSAAQKREAEEAEAALRRLLCDDPSAQKFTPPPVMPLGQASKQQQPTRPFRTVPWVPAFTRRRERLVGKVAAFGMAGTILGEVWTGLGPVHQLAMETGLAPGTIARVLTLLAVGGLLGGLLPGSPTWDPANQADVRLGRGGKAPATTPGQAASELKKPGTWLPSVAWLGFNARNELLLGQLSMFLFAAELFAEATTPGNVGLFVSLGLLRPGGMELGDAPLLLLGTAFALLVAALGRKTLDE